jgi:hypothetical protein
MSVLVDTAYGVERTFQKTCTIESVARSFLEVKLTEMRQHLKGVGLLDSGGQRHTLRWRLRGMYSLVLES